MIRTAATRPPLRAAAGACGSALLGAVARAQEGGAAEGADGLEQVTVSGVRSLLADRLGEDPQDVPQSLTVITRELIEAQGLTRLEDALRNVPGITLNAGEGAARGATVNLRGFPVFNDFFLDGIRDAAVYDRDSFNLESVEVLEGPAAVLFGRGSTGGAINQVSKAPLAKPLAALSASLGSNALYRGTADLNQPFGVANAARLNAMAESSQVAGRDLTRNRRWGIAPALEFGIGAAPSLTLAFLHQQEDNVPDPGVPFLDRAPAPVPRSAFFGLAGDRARNRVDIGTLRASAELAPGLALAETLRYARYDFSYLGTLPNLGLAPAPGTPPAAVSVERDAPDSAGLHRNLTNQTDLTARGHTGPLGHTLTLGIELARQTLDTQRYANPFDTDPQWLPPVPLLAPDPDQSAPPKPVAQTQTTLAHALGVYLTDRLSVGQHWEMLLGARYDRFAAEYRQRTLTSGAELALRRTDALGSPRAALLFKPTPRQTYYLGYGTSFDPSAEALALSAATANLGPVRAHSYEAGVKAGLLGARLAFSGALFRTEVDNAQTNDPVYPTRLVLNGDQRVDGVEVGLNGYLATRWEVFGGYTYLHSRTLTAGTAADIGKALPNTARNALNLWTEFEVSPRLELGAGTSWLGPRFADPANLVRIPGFIVWNTMLTYRLSPRLTVQLNGLNLTDRLYYAAPYYNNAAENHIVPGAARSATLSVRATL